MKPRVGDLILTRTVPSVTFITAQSPASARTPRHGLAVVTAAYDSVEAIGCYFVMGDYVNNRQLIYSDEITRVIR